MSGAVAAVAALINAMLAGVITVGNNGVPSVYGFLASAPYGSIAPGSYVDRGGTTRTVSYWNWSASPSGTVTFGLSGTGIANSDTTFAAVVLGGRRLLRSAATYTASVAGSTEWAWSVDTSAYPTSGTVQALVQ